MANKEEGKQRLGAELNYADNPNFRVKIGTVNKHNPQVIYITCTCWITPQVQLQQKKYDGVIEYITNEIKEYIKETFIIPGHFDRKHIFDLETCTDDMTMGKPKYLNFELYLKQNKDNVKKLTEIEPFVSKKLNTLFKDIVELFKENDFAVDKNKKI